MPIPVSTSAPRVAVRESRAWFGRADCEFRRSNAGNIVFQLEDMHEVATDPESHKLFAAHDWSSLVEHWRTLSPTNIKFREKMTELQMAEAAAGA